MHVLELPQKPADSDAMVHWVSELRKLKTKLQDCFGVEITDEKIRQAISTMNRERQLRRELAGSDEIRYTTSDRQAASGVQKQHLRN